MATNSKTPYKKPCLEKRPHETDSDSDAREQELPVSNDNEWPRFIMIQSSDEERPLVKLSPFAVHKGIQGIAGTVKEVKRLRSGDILVTCLKKAQADNLLRATTLANVGIKASPHRSLNSSKGVIRARELRYTDEDEIKQELRPQGVVNVRRMEFKKEGQVVKTDTYILTFNRPEPPRNLIVGYLNIKVDLFIPNPLRCFKCQKFGHGKDRCRAEVACFRCGQKGHDNTACQNDPKCINCQGDHMAISKNCPVWIKEKEIQRVKLERQISFPEARKFVEGTSPSQMTRTYSAAVSKPPTRTIECQTEMTWLNREKPEKATTPVKSLKVAAHKKSISCQTAAVQTRPEQSQKPKVDKVKKQTDRLSKAVCDPVSHRNRFDILQDVEMAEATTSRCRSLSPKIRLVKGRTPVKPP